jgi:hypothetical protein
MGNQGYGAFLGPSNALGTWHIKPALLQQQISSGVPAEQYSYQQLLWLLLDTTTVCLQVKPTPNSLEDSLPPIGINNHGTG